MYNILKINLKNKLAEIIIILLFCYDLLTYLPDSLSPSVVKIVYYALLFFLYINYIIISNGFNKNQLLSIDLFFLITFIFSFLYLFRVFIDLYFFEIFHNTYQGKFTYIYIFINSVIFPLFFLKLLDFSKINYLKLNYILSSILVFCLILSFNTIIKIGFIGNRFDANESLDTISFGHLGISLFLIALNVIVNSKKYLIKILFILFQLFGLLVAIFANSRSPILALIVCIIFYTLVIKKFKLLFISIIVFILFIFYIQELNVFFSSYGTGFVERLANSFLEYDNKDITSGRNEIYFNSINEFFENPFFGSSFLIQSEPKGEYPHNLVIESFMALGIIGGVLFMSLIFITLKKAFKLIRINKKYTFISLLFVQYLIFSMFSRSIINLPLFWVTMILVNYIYNNELKSESNS